MQTGMGSAAPSLASKRGWTEKLRGLEHGGLSTPALPTPSPSSDGESLVEEQWITRHIAHVIQRREFILKLTRALMMLGGPSHRLRKYRRRAMCLTLKSTACTYRDIATISFDDSLAGTSNPELIRQGNNANET
ncbi:hypothetical protein C8R47DRAFT_1212182 [Mycena vitilis]|nr:hypothetical protein C8R47DRAFT_1212182 [Mycena vitilis]